MGPCNHKVNINCKNSLSGIHQYLPNLRYFYEIRLLDPWRFRYFKNFQKCHQKSPKIIKNVTKCHEIKIIKNHQKSFNLTWWHFMTYGDIWWPLMTFDDFLWQNHVVYHDMSWHIMNCHDISPTNSEMPPLVCHSFLLIALGSVNCHNRREAY